MESGTKDQKYVYIPDALILNNEKRDKLTVAKLLGLIDISYMPQLIFYVTSGDVTQTWEFRQPAGYNLDSAAGGNSETGADTKLAHWRTVIRQKLNRVLTNTAKSCNESGAYFCIDSSGYDAIGWYLQAGCAASGCKDIRLLSIAHGVVGEQDPGAGAFGWCEEVMKEFKSTEGGVEEVDKELGCNIVMRKPDDVVEFNDSWLDGDRLSMSSAEIEAKCKELGIDAALGGEHAYKYHPSSAPTHYIVCESLAGRKIVESILNKSVASGEFIINGSFVGAAKRVATALNAERPLFVFQHTGGCADLASVMLDQVKVVQRLHTKQEADARKAGKDSSKPRKRLEDLMAEHLPFDPFKATEADWIIEKAPAVGMPKVQFTGIVGNKSAKTQPELIAQINAIFANFPPNADPGRRLVIDPFVQRGEALQDLISRTMCSAGDNNNDELNGEFADQKRLHLAWEMHGALSHAAKKQQKTATTLQGLILVLSFLTLAIAQLRSNVEWFIPFLEGVTTTNPVDAGTGTRRLAEMAGSVFSSIMFGRLLSEPLEGETTSTTGGASCAENPTSAPCEATAYLSIVIPAVVTTLLTVQSYLAPDDQVIVLKSGASRIETEIYLFRTRTGPYGRAALAGGGDEDGDGTADGGAPIPARERFGKKVTAIWTKISESSVSEHSMPRRVASHDHKKMLKKEYEAAQDMVAKYMPGELGNGTGDEEDQLPLSKSEQKAKDKADKAKAKKVANSPKGKKVAPKITEEKDDQPANEDTGFGPMSAENYVRFRMLPKLIAYSKLSPVQSKRKTQFKMLAIGLSAATTLLGALDRSVPVPLIVQLGSALAGWEAYKQMNISVKLTNSAVGQLERLVLWWQSLSMIQKRRPDNKERLVLTTEDVISSAVPELAISKQMESNDEGAEEQKAAS